MAAGGTALRCFALLYSCVGKADAKLSAADAFDDGAFLLVPVRMNGLDTVQQALQPTLGGMTALSNARSSILPASLADTR